MTELFLATGPSGETEIMNIVSPLLAYLVASLAATG